MIIDENATSQIACGNLLCRHPDLPSERDDQISLGFNRSKIPQAAMIGDSEIDVFGIESGDEIPVITADTWMLT